MGKQVCVLKVSDEDGNTVSLAQQDSGEEIEGGSEMSAPDFTTMTDSELERFLCEHDLVACGTGDCLHRRCIWCGSEAEEVLAKLEEENEQ